jgi:nicotinamide-nucleotide amidase
VSEEDARADALARQAAALVGREETVATAESLTGGRLAARCTEVPGSSAWYVGGVVSYATSVKADVLGVPDAIVEREGVVSAACAEAMAVGVRDLLGATYGVSTTGVAGPDRQEGKPVGTVFVGVAGPERTDVTELTLGGDRAEIQDAAVAGALSALAAMMGAQVDPAAR